MTSRPERPRVVATARSYCAEDGPHQQLVRDAGLELVLAAGNDPHGAPALAALAADADGLILGLDRCDERVFAAAPRLRVVARYGVGTDSVDLEAARRYGVTVTNTPGANTVAVAELTFALMLALARDLPAAVAGVRGGGWRRVRGWELSGKTLGLIGLGQIGCAVAERARAFGMTVIGHDPYAFPAGIEHVPLAELWPRSDVISLHLALGASTRHLVNAETLGRCRPGAILVNTARGGLVDEQALAAALREGRLAGAAADAFESEPPQDSPLLSLPNFVATPHLGATTREAARNMGLAAAADVVAVLAGGRPRYPVAAAATPRRT
jgi:D-3-phosphoglycerate dehydrogenase / 2-oxoglutarate reductase